MQELLTAVCVNLPDAASIQDVHTRPSPGEFLPHHALCSVALCSQATLIRIDPARKVAGRNRLGDVIPLCQIAISST